MSLLQERQQTATAIAEGRFVAHVLRQAAVELDADIEKRMSSFSSAFWRNRNFAVNNTTLTYTTLKKHRFLDMKTRQTNQGPKTKKRYEIHNKPIFGHLNNIIREINIGFTDAVKAKFMQLEN